MILDIKITKSEIRLIAASSAPSRFVIRAILKDGTRKYRYVSFEKAGVCVKSIEWENVKEVYAVNITVSKSTKTLYISRPLLNGQEFIEWARDSGFKKTLLPDDLHCTIAFSRQKLDWRNVSDVNEDVPVLKIKGGSRSVIPLGDKGAIVLKFRSTTLHNRWQQIINQGASWDYDGYRPHVTITYDGSGMSGMRLKAIEPYSGDLRFGPEKWTEVVEDWDEKIKEG